MSLPVSLRPLANADVQQIRDDCDAYSPGLGDKFLDRLQELLDRIEAMPELYAVVWQRVRAARLRSFRHVVYYIVHLDRVDVIAVIHGSRHLSAGQLRV